jgi:hypothetical protein
VHSDGLRGLWRVLLSYWWRLASKRRYLDASPLWIGVKVQKRFFCFLGESITFDAGLNAKEASEFCLFISACHQRR